MNLATREMKKIDAVEIAAWTYEPPYDLYNSDGSETSVNELLNGSYRVIESLDGQIVGFYCIGESAQVPAGHGFGAYPTTGGDVVDIGLGMRPDLTGRRLGSQLLGHILRDITTQHPTADIRLTVATFNKRAIKLYQKFGFKHKLDFEHNGIAFRTMKRSAVTTNDIYCDEILSGRLPVEKVLETDQVLAFHHTRPSYPVHIVVIPKKHILSLIYMDEQDIEILHELLEVVRKVAADVTAVHGACGVSTYMGDYQSSKHMHWHVIFGDELK